MKEILNKAERRRLKFIELMYFYGNQYDKKTILTKLRCKESTLRADIDYLNEHFKNLFNIQMTGQEISLNYLKNASISSFYNKILNSLKVFNMIELLFFQTSDSIEELSYNLYTSVSTIYRMIDRFNSLAIEKYKVYLDTKDLKFKGKETDIRSFYIQFFSEKYTFCEWPFQVVKYHDIVDFIKYIYKIANLKITYSDMNIIAMITAVNIYRFKQGYYLYEDKKNYNIFKVNSNRCIGLFKKLIEDSDNQKNIAAHLNKLGIPNNLIAYEEIFGVFLQEDFASSFDKMINNADEVASFEISLVNILKFTYSLNQKYDINLNNLDNLVQCLHNGSILFNIIPNSNYIFFDRNRLYVEKMKSRFPEFVTDATSYLSKYIVSLHGSCSRTKLNFLLYILFTIWDDLIPQLYERYDKIKVLILSRYNLYHAKSVKSQLELFFNFFIDIDLCEEESIDIAYLNNCDADLIITDSNLPNDLKKKWIRIHGNHSLKDYKFVTDTLYNIMKQKKELYNIVHKQ